jgi:hypothetical protein
VRGRPVFIDLTSIEKPARLDLWFALGQFNRMFLYPLLLAKHAGWDLRSYFLSNLDGRSTLQVGQAFSFFKRWSPALLLDIGLPFALEKKVKAGKAAAPVRPPPRPAERAAGHPAAQQMTLRRLDKKIAALAEAVAPETVWGDYTQICSYDGEAEASKKALVREFLQQALSLPRSSTSAATPATTRASPPNAAPPSSPPISTSARWTRCTGGSRKSRPPSPRWSWTSPTRAPASAI